MVKRELKTITLETGHVVVQKRKKISIPKNMKELYLEIARRNKKSKRGKELDISEITNFCRILGDIIYEQEVSPQGKDKPWESVPTILRKNAMRRAGDLKKKGKK